MADIFDEIDEELKRENAQALWSRYGKFVIAAVAAVILAVGSAQGFKAWKTKQAETAANAYQLALDDDVVASLSQVMADLTDGYVMLAQFRLAAAKAADGDSEGAVADYMMLAENKAIKPLYQQAALLLGVMNAPDGADPKQLQDQLALLWQHLVRGRVWRWSRVLPLILKRTIWLRRSALSPFLDSRNFRQNCASGRKAQLVSILKSAAEDQ